MKERDLQIKKDRWGVGGRRGGRCERGKAKGRKDYEGESWRERKGEEEEKAREGEER